MHTRNFLEILNGSLPSVHLAASVTSPLVQQLAEFTAFSLREPFLDLWRRSQPSVIGDTPVLQYRYTSINISIYLAHLWFQMLARVPCYPKSVVPRHLPFHLTTDKLSRL
ncbi:hypothetical protein L798_08228 [Zootermopsis nevadensis]|uniref:Uncharacterized protein n=1 Tax=Zootermopsis nevadensis TaxID=136037 RepID=A0A067R376_ZOONE|nr:hypothetical protein L798_08228 [Zootermopsis nevadensis]